MGGGRVLWRRVEWRVVSHLRSAGQQPEDGLGSEGQTLRRSQEEEQWWWWEETVPGGGPE